MATELIPLKPEQHTVTFVPKMTTDLPFFNLTYRRKEIPKSVRYEGVDEAGHPIRWEVYHNTNEEIGPAGVEAHEVWYLLIKPAIDASRKINGSIPQIIQLGGMRECLRMVGWTAGGHQAKELIKSLTQIAFAGCVADLWFPTGEMDANGKQKYLQVKSRFSRLSIYAIGEHHLSEEELKNIEFEFDLEDKLYIRLDPIEIRLQQLQAGQQRLLDNAYMFSVKPIARRWYELLAGKMFGTLKYNAPYFEIRYSWYIKHHHTLKKFHQRFRIVEQMNRVVQEHLDSGFLTKVEYRKIKEPDCEEDFLIRYFVGAAAKESINRIQGHILNRKKREVAGQVSVKENTKPEIAKTAVLSPLKIETDTELPLGGNIVSQAANFASGEVSGKQVESVFAITTLESQLLPAQIELFEKLKTDFLIAETKAYELLKTYPVERIGSQIEAFAFREEKITGSRAGFLIRAIEENYSYPDGYLQNLKKIEAAKTVADRQATIDACQFCDERGWRNIKSERDPFYGLMHQCTHHTETESQYVEHEA